MIHKWAIASLFYQVELSSGGRGSKMMMQAFFNGKLAEIEELVRVAVRGAQSSLTRSAPALKSF
jgi:hypothetical protein